MRWVIEPHADDAFLSLHQHMTKVWTEPVCIVTVYCDNRRAKESAKYAEAIGVEHLPLYCVEGGSMKDNAGELTPLRKAIDNRTIDPAKGTIVAPIGIQHPEHIAVARLVRQWLPISHERYLEIPYYTKQKLSQEMQSKVEHKQVVSMVWASNRKWKYIDIFKSQSKFFYFNPPGTLPRLEIVLRSSF